MRDNHERGRGGAPDVALFLPTLGGGGAERVTINLARGLLNAGVAVDLLVGDPTGAYGSELPDGVKLVDLKVGRVLAAVPALVRYLRRERPHAYMSAMNHANVISIWAKQLAGYRGKVVLVEHNDLVRAGRNDLVEGKIIPWLVGRTYPQASSVVAVSKGVRRSLIEGARLDGDLVEVIYNPVLTDGIQSAAAKPVEHPFFEEGGPPVILGVGRLTAQKNFSNLIHAFAQVIKVHDARLIILGEGEQRPRLEELIAELALADKVSLPGFAENPFAFLAKADLFVLSSDFEGLPTVLIEALAVGARAVSTDCPSGPREILDGGRYGRLVPVGDASALAQGILQSLSEPRPQLGDWLQQFTLAYATRRYLTSFGLT